jgi:hypothetical protein
VNIVKDKTNEIVSAGLRSVAASFPVFASVGQAWTEFETHRKFDRMEQFFKDLKLEMEALAQTVNKMREDTPELLERTLDLVQREASEQKRRAFAAVFLRCAKSTKSLDEQRTIIETLDVLSEEDIRLLREFQPGLAIRVDALEQKFDLGLLAKVLSRLESRGLVGQTSGDTSFVYIGPRDYWKNRWRPRYYELLPFGEEFARILGWTGV